MLRDVRNKIDSYLFARLKKQAKFYFELIAWNDIIDTQTLARVICREFYEEWKLYRLGCSF